MFAALFEDSQKLFGTVIFVAQFSIATAERSKVASVLDHFEWQREFERSYDLEGIERRRNNVPCCRENIGALYGDNRRIRYPGAVRGECAWL